MKVSVIISLADKREQLFSRSLDTWGRQTLPKEEWEILAMDDGQRESMRELCRMKAQEYGIRIRFIRIDPSKNALGLTETTFIPVLSVNVGIRRAAGDVIVVTGPETLQGLSNLNVAAGMISRQECGYGIVWRATSEGTDSIAAAWPELADMPISSMFEIPGVRGECVTTPPWEPEYWYLMAVAKKHLEAIGGLDERFAAGLCAEDTDLANRLGLAGIKPVYEHNMAGVHQDHSREDDGDGVHIDRRQEKGYHCWVHNFNLMKANLETGDPVANKGIEWGSEAMIVFEEPCL